MIALLLLVALALGSGQPDAAEARLWAWLQENGAHTANVQLARGPFGRTLVAARPVAVGDPILSVPAALCMSHERIAEHAPHLLELPLSPDDRMILFVAHERLRGAESFWHAYLDALPPPSALRETSALYHMAAVERIMGVAAAPAATYAADRAAERARLSAYLPDHETLLWVQAIRASRAWQAREGLSAAWSLRPLVDLLNHHPERGNFATPSPSGTGIDVLARVPLAVGDEAFDMYTQPDDSSELALALSFGFADAAFARVTLSMSERFDVTATPADLGVDRMIAAVHAIAGTSDELAALEALLPALATELQGPPEPLPADAPPILRQILTVREHDAALRQRLYDGALERWRQGRLARLSPAERSLWEWLAGPGQADLSGVMLTHHPEHGRTLVAARPLRATERVAVVPAARFALRASPGCALAAPACAVLRLLAEADLGPASFWAPYLRLLPAADELRRTSLLFHPELLAHRPELAELRQTAERLMDDLGPLVAGGRERVRWAHATLLARGWTNLTGSGDFELHPLVDLANHDALRGGHVKTLGGLVYIRAGTDLAVGEEVRIQYGEPGETPAVQALARYGFADPALAVDVEASMVAADGQAYSVSSRAVPDVLPQLRQLGVLEALHAFAAERASRLLEVPDMPGRLPIEREVRKLEELEGRLWRGVAITTTS